MSSPLEVDVATAAQLVRAGTPLIDVREPAETAISQIAGSRLIPIAQIPAHLPDLPKDRQVLILCHHGGRSARVTQFLRAHGWENATNVAGGIDAWARDVDPTLRRY